MRHPRRTTGGATAALLLACALGTAACGSGSPSDSRPRTVAAFTTDQPLTADALGRAAEQLRQRAELLGLADPKVTTGGGVLTLSVAGPIGDRLAALTHRPALELRPVLAAAATGATPAAPVAGLVPAPLQDRFTALDCAADPAADPGDQVLACGDADSGPGRAKFALGPVALRGTDITGSSALLAPDGSGWQVQLDFTPAGTTAFADLTGRIAALDAPANQLAVLLDGTIVSHPAVRDAITGGSAVITGGFDADKAKQLAAQLATPALPPDLHPVTPAP
ncbi:SecDF P1 head subdomain-containing protein [Kitasatospora cineracea]|uniref:SecDF P1 head subdomain-containing protein n=1 Tax=Kitasatospora cineracea TaxID=88074 RepID=UPI003811987F